MDHQNRNIGVLKHMARHPGEKRLAEPAVCVVAHHQHAWLGLASDSCKGLLSRSLAGLRAKIDWIDAVPAETTHDEPEPDQLIRAVWSNAAATAGVLTPYSRQK